MNKEELITKVLDSFELVHGWRPKAICKDKIGYATCYPSKAVLVEKAGMWVNSHIKINSYFGRGFVKIQDHWPDHTDWKTPIYMEGET